MERVYRVAYIDTDRPESDVRRIFSQCGEIRGIYPGKPDDSHSKTRFFVEFTEQGSVKRARALQHSDIKVHILAYSPNTIAQFTDVAPSSAAPRSQKLEVNEDLSLLQRSAPYKPRKQQRYKSNSRGQSSRKFPESRQRRAQYEAKRPYSRLSPGSSPPWATGSSPFRKATEPIAQYDVDKENDSFQSVYSHSQPPPPVIRDPCGTTFPVVCTPMSQFFSSHSADLAPFSAGSVYFPPSVSLDSRLSESTSRTVLHSSPTVPSSPSIVLTYAGGSFICDLESLTDDPEEVISVLKRTAALALERDKWMIVAGYYRGKNNITAAVAVVTAMIQVMTSPAVGMAELELKPALLMLSSCYADLGKRIRATVSGDRSVADEYFAKAQEYLKKVYGRDVPAADAPPRTNPTTRRESLENATNFPRSRSSPQAKSATTVDPALVENLQRENQTLLDRQSTNAAYLSQSRIAKRQLEEELAAERHLRRKTKRELEQATHELADARRSEAFALETCKQEVDNRRRVEERAIQLRDELAAMRREGEGRGEREKKLRDVVGRVGALLVQVANGEGVFGMEGKTESGTLEALEPGVHRRGQGTI